MISVTGRDLDNCDLDELYREVGLSIDSYISNMSEDDLDSINLDISHCRKLLNYLQDRVEQELVENDE